MKRLNLNFWFSPPNILFYSFLVVVLVILVNTLVYKDRPENFLSRVFVSLADGQTKEVTLNFDLNKKEEQAFFDFAQNLGSNWTGQPISFSLNDFLFAGAGSLDGFNFGLKAEAKSLKFLSSKKLTKLEKEETDNNWDLASFFPENTFLFSQNRHLALLLPAGLKTLTGSERGGLGLFNLDNNVQVAWVFEISDKTRLEDEISKLVQADTEGLKVTEGVVESVKTFNYLASGAPLTFGFLEGKLVITTGEEAFRRVVKIKNSGSDNLERVVGFEETTTALAPSGGASLYFKTNSLAKDSSWKNLQGIIEVDSSDGSNLLPLLEKIHSLGVVLDNNSHLSGVLNLN